MATTTTAQKTITCGFCDTGAHGLCPGGVRNGDGTIVLCVCPERYNPGNCNAGIVRCTDCQNRRSGEVNTDTWKCIDRDACAAEQQRKVDSNPFVQQMAKVRAAREALERSAPTRTAPSAPRSSETPERPREVSSSGSRACLCLCGGHTKGGKFLPGHDSKYLNALVANPGDESRTLAYAVSDAFGAKYEKRIK